MSEWSFQKWDGKNGYIPCSMEEADREAEKQLEATKSFVYIAIKDRWRYDAVHVVKCLKAGIDPTFKTDPAFEA